MKQMNKSIVLGSVLAATMVSGAAMAELSTNIGATSNYIWRGVTQSGDDSAISGGIDYGHESGAYAGTWTSNLGGGQYELDLYAGYAGEAGEISYDVGIIQYRYPISDVKLDFTEVQASVGFGPASLYVAKTIGTEDGDADGDGLYIALSAETEVAKDYTAGITLGSYTGDDIEATFGDTYKHFAVTLSKGDFTFAIEKNDISDADLDGDGTDDVVDLDDPRVTVSWGKEF